MKKHYSSPAYNKQRLKGLYSWLIRIRPLVWRWLRGSFSQALNGFVLAWKNLVQYISPVDSPNCAYRTHTSMSTLTTAKVRLLFPKPASPALYERRAKQVLHLFVQLLCEFLLFCLAGVDGGQLVSILGCTQRQYELSGVFMRPWVGTRAKSPPTPTYCVQAGRFPPNQSVGAVWSYDRVYCDFPMLAQEFHLEDPIHAGRHKEPAVYAKHNYPSTWREIQLMSQCTGLAHTGKLTWIEFGWVFQYSIITGIILNCLV